ncbi:MAG: DNA adenine methylase [Desulfurellales bacterium]|nr:MAG: DNA adenine methylase [Desulfurellales bacterium]
MTPLRPFFSYYGSCWRQVRHLPPPTQPRLIEPFAGSASYALHYPHLKIHLNDINPTVAGTWEFLIKASASEILALPDEPHDGLPQEARWLIGWWLGKAQSQPRIGAPRGGWASKYAQKSSAVVWTWGQAARERIARQVGFIRHWRITSQNYLDLEGVSATWFIDPPYDCPAGEHYPHGRGGLDFAQIAHWCRSRSGQVVAIERDGARWLPFVALRQGVGASCRRRVPLAVWGSEGARTDARGQCDLFGWGK